MDLDIQISKAYQAIDQYDASSNKVINSKFKIVNKKSYFAEAMARIFSNFFPGHHHIAQTNLDSVFKRILKLANSKDATPAQKEELQKIVNKLRDLKPYTTPTTPATQRIETDPLLSKKIGDIAAHKGKLSELNALEYAFLYELAAEIVDPSMNPERMGLNNENLWRPCTEFSSSDTFGYNNGIFNALLSCYFGKENCIGVGEDLTKKYAGVEKGFAFGKGLNFAHPIAYFPVITTAASPEGVYETIKKDLHLLATADLPKEQLPSKMFIPIFCNNNSLGHVMLMVIEPSASQEKAARITTINTSVGLCGFDPYENEAVRAAHEFYSASETTVFQNKEIIFSTGHSCGVDQIELMRKLSTVPNAQKHVAKGLSKNGSSQYKKIRQQQAQDLAHFYQQYK